MTMAFNDEQWYSVMIAVGVMIAVSAMTTLNLDPRAPLERLRVRPSNAFDTLSMLMAPLWLASRL